MSATVNQAYDFMDIEVNSMDIRRIKPAIMDANVVPADDDDQPGADITCAAMDIDDEQVDILSYFLAAVNINSEKADKDGIDIHMVDTIAIRPPSASPQQQTRRPGLWAVPTWTWPYWMRSRGPLKRPRGKTHGRSRFRSASLRRKRAVSKSQPPVYSSMHT